MERQRRKADIEKGLQFIQSTLPLKQEEYEAFLLKLVQNLFAEGNDLFREKDYKQALVQYMEGLNVADYAASDQVALPRELLCKLHVNRAACYFTMGLYEKALEDSEKALGLDSENIRALFRKARALMTFLFFFMTFLNESYLLNLFTEGVGRSKETGGC